MLLLHLHHMIIAEETAAYGVICTVGYTKVMPVLVNLIHAVGRI